MLSLLTMSQAGQYCWPIQAPDKARVLVAALHWACVVQARDICSWRAELVVARLIVRFGSRLCGKGVGISAIVSETPGFAIMERRSAQNRLPDRARRSLGRLLTLV